MRPIVLEMQAFGPFAKQQKVDFSALATDALFLINGVTGSGKTTLLDAISYALYGETTGNERSAGEMRSDHADPELLTEISLIFELANQQYRIKRIPEQLRPKKSGEGFTRQIASAELYQIVDDDEVLLVPRKATEATQKIVELTGLSAEQFRQVMVLPQGKFRELLLASSDQREQIFEQLFQTGIYRKIQDKLKQKAIELARQQTEIKQKIAGIVESGSLQSVAEMQQQLEELAQQLIEATEQQEQAALQLAEARQTFEAARQLTEVFEQQSAISRQLDDVYKRADEIQQANERLAHAKAAMALQADFVQLQTARQQRQTAQGQRVNYYKHLRQCESQYEELSRQDEQTADKKQQLDELAKAIMQLQGYQKQAKVYAQLSEQMEAAVSNLEFQSRQHEEAVAKLEESKQKSKVLEQSLADAQRDVLAITEKTTFLRQLTTQHEMWQRQQSLISVITDKQSALAEAEQWLQQCRQNHQSQKTQHDKLLLKWHQGQASLLAVSLQVDAPCPVCGSLDHPAPAVHTQDMPDQQQIEQSEFRLSECQAIEKKAELAYQSGLQDIENDQQTLSRLTDDIARDAVVDTADLPVSMAQAKAEIERLRSLEVQLPQQQNQLNSLTDTISASENTILQQTDQLRLLELKLNEYSGQRQQIEQDLPQQWRDADALSIAIIKGQNRQNQLAQDIEQLQQKMATAQQDLAAARANLEQSETQCQQFEDETQKKEVVWADAIENSCFDAEKQFLLTRLKPQQIALLETDIADYDKVKNELQARLQDKQAVIADQKRPDLSVVEQQYIDKKQLEQQAQKHLHELSGRKQALLRQLAQIEKYQQQQDRLAKKYAVSGHLSDIANGKNTSKLSLQRFVLTVLLDDVLREADFRLAKMSNGRYRLLRKQSISDKRKQGGLDLDVFDAYTDRQRPVATLSGGESFIAALSLALGLSDVVQAYSGGIRLDALFIDEGFGSLDAESLDLAIATLMELQSSGRMVGIISHVPELKAQIINRLDVVASPSGSHIIQH